MLTGTDWGEYPSEKFAAMLAAQLPNAIGAQLEESVRPSIPSEATSGLYQPNR
jgi:hypothetical protein